MTDQDVPNTSKLAMVPTKLDIALNALQDVIVETLNSGDSNRFAKASTMATLASKVAAQGAKNMRDVKHLVPNGANGQFAIGYGHNVGYDAPEYVNPENGQGFIAGDNGLVQPAVATIGGDIGTYANPEIQHAMAAIQPMIAGTAKSNIASVRRNQATELRELVDTRNQMQGEADADSVAKIQRRIDQLVAIIAMPQENTHGTDVVPTELSRGHSAGADQQEPDEAYDLRPDACGEAGDAGGAPRSGEGPSGGTVLEPHGRPPFGSALAEGTEPGAAGTDLEGAEAPAEAAETGARSGERGALRGREDAGDDGAAAAAYRPGYERYRGLDHAGNAIFDGPDFLRPSLRDT